MTAGAGSGVAAGRGADSEVDAGGRVKLHGERQGSRLGAGSGVAGRVRGRGAALSSVLAPALQPQNARENLGTRACPRESRGSRGGGHSGVSGQRLTSDPVAKPAAPQYPGASQPLPLTSGFWAPSWRRRALPLLRGGAALGAGLRGAGAELGCCRDRDPFTVLRPQGSNLTPLDSLGLSFL